MKVYTVVSGTGNLTCGHAHKTREAAERCGARLYDSHYIGDHGQRVRNMNRGSWTACAAWHGYRVEEWEK
jgi:hypothetical protein